MRLFFAVLPDDSFRDALTGAQDALRKRQYTGHFTDPRSLHLTLCFIGEYSDPDAVLEQAERIRFAPFPLTLSGYIGSFGDLLWAGAEPDPALAQSAKRLRHVLAEAQIPFDRKPFYPHITLLRNAASRQPFSDIVVARVHMDVCRISLMRSDFGKHGAQYTEISFLESAEESRGGAYHESECSRTAGSTFTHRQK